MPDRLGRDVEADEEGDEGADGVGVWWEKACRSFGAGCPVNLIEEVSDRVGRGPILAPTKLVADDGDGDIDV